MADTTSAEGAELGVDRLLELSAETNRRFLGRFKSLNDKTEYALEVAEVKKKVPRFKTTAWSDFFSNALPIDPISYSRRLFKALIDGLASQNLQTSRMLLQNFEWLMPGPDTTPTQLSIFESVFTQAMTVSNEQLQTIIKMEPSHGASPGTAPGHHFYIRSFEMTAQELDDLLGTITKNDARFEESDEWVKLLQLCRRDKEPPSAFTIRYVGMVEGPRRPIDRHVEDIGEKKSGLFGEFLRSLQECHPEVYMNAQVHLLPDASLPIGSFVQPDDIERMLIQFFHYPTLINRQRGGFYASYVPSSGDADIFRNLKTDFWFHFNRNASLPWTDTRAEVAVHCQEVQLYANRNPDETGTGHRKFSDEQRETIRQSGTPFAYSGYNILLFIGKDITLESNLNCKAFIDGTSRAGYLTRDFIYRLVRYEAQAHNRAWIADSFDPKTSAWCFVDLWPWLWHRKLPRATEFLQSYMQIVKPLIAVAYGKNVNAITRASFQHQNGVPMNLFASIVAKPSIQFYNVDEETGLPDEDSAFINIPYIHPGRDKYGPQDVRLRRAMDLSLQYVFLIGHVTLKVIEDIPDESDLPNRKQLCEQILQEVDALCTSSPYHKQFYENLQQARNDLIGLFGISRASWSKKSTKSTKESLLQSTIEERPMLNTADGRATITSLGQAVGKPGSSDRAEQLTGLWDKNMPDLHVLIPHEDDHRTAWIKAMSQVEQNQYYYLHILSQLPEDQYTEDTLRDFCPKWADGPDWLQDPKARHEAAQQAGLWVAKERQQDGEIETVGERNSHAYLSPQDCQGRILKIFANGQFLIRWITKGGEHTTTRLMSKIAIPKTTFRRYLRFTELGIDITASGGEVFRAQLSGGRSANATISVKSFMHDPVVVELWREACKAHGLNTDVLNDIDEDAVEWGAKGVKMLVGNAQSETPQQNRPPLDRDANWLLNEFLNQTDHLADGGAFRTALQDNFPDSTEDINAFVDFIKRPEYIKHPYTADWRRYLENEKPQNQVLAKNLPVLRNCVTVSVSTARYVKSVGKSKKVSLHERYFILGAPGSALDDPFAEGSDQSCISEDTKKKKKKKAAAAAEATEAEPEAEGSKTKRKRGDEGEEDDVDPDLEEDEDAVLKPKPNKSKS